MGKPMTMDMLSAAPVEEDEELGGEGEELPEAPAKGDPEQILNELQAALDKLRPLLGSMG